VRLLLHMVADAGRRGYQLLLEGFWQDLERDGRELPSERPPSAAALCQARAKLDPHGLRVLLHRAAAHFEEQHGVGHRWKGRRLVAVDGSRTPTQRSAALLSYFGKSTGSHVPIASVSTLFDVLSKVPLDVAVRAYGTDERRDLLDEHAAHLRQGDVLILDRGYPSFEVLRTLLAGPADFVVRVPAKSTFRALVDFLADGRREGWITLHMPRRERTASCPTIRVRAVRIERDAGEPLVLLTSLDAGVAGVQELDELYHLRWNIEEYYKLVKGDYLGQGQLRARTPAGVIQEIMATALLVSLTRHLMASAAAHHDVPYDRLSQKRCMLLVAEHLPRVLGAHTVAQALEIIDQVTQWMVVRLEDPRPGRSYPRQSFKPRSKWASRGRRAAGA